MGLMFQDATSFNQPLNNWNVSNVTDMMLMFTRARSFNRPLNNWNVSKVETMFAMFDDATSLNQPLHAPWYQACNQGYRCRYGKHPTSYTSLLAPTYVGTLRPPRPA